MTELTIRELNAVVRHLTKVNEVQDQNDDYENEIDLDIPERIALSRTTNGMTLGHIQYSADLGEHVFVPKEEEVVKPPHWANVIPTPPPFN